MHIKPTITDYFVVIYVALITGEIILSQLKLIKARYNWRDTMAATCMTLGVVATTAITTFIVVGVYSIAYRFRAFTMPETAWWSWVALLLLDDFAYYWFHRLSHEVRFWWASHVNHHSSQNYNLSTNFRQTWTGEITATWLPWIPLALLGYRPEMLILAHSFNLFYQFWIHTETIRRMPPWFEYMFNTPSHHRVHHASNPRYLDRNYAGILIIWDRLFGTFVREEDEEPVRYGIVHNINTYNPLKIAFHEWMAIVRDLGSVRSPGEALGVVFGPPGWKQDETSDHIRKAWLAEQQQVPSPAS